MAALYKPVHFKIWELVPPELINLPEDYLWGLFDENILIVIDRLRSCLGKPITINNWKSGGQFSLRGFRPKNCTIGAINSPHKQGKGIDFDVKGMTAKEVRDFIMKRQDQFPEITRMEDKVTWVHIDTMPRNGWLGIKLFNP
jgi:hypothetical protein